MLIECIIDGKVAICHQALTIKNYESLSPGDRCCSCKDKPRVVESWLFTRLLALVLGPAGEQTDGRGREVEGGRCCCGVSTGNSVDGYIGEKLEFEASRGMDGRRRLLVVVSESRLDMFCVLLGD